MTVAAENAQVNAALAAQLRRVAAAARGAPELLRVHHTERGEPLPREGVILGLALVATLHQPIPRRAQFGLFRM